MVVGEGQLGQSEVGPAIPEPRHVREWLSWIMTERWDGLARQAVRWSRRDETAEASDIVHDAVVKVLAGDVHLPDDHKRAWLRLLATIRNVARNRYRSEQIRRTEPLGAVPVSAERVGDGRRQQWTICQRWERESMIGLALERLTEDQREVVRLRYVEGWTVAEVAEHRECSASAVKQLAGKARATFRAAMSESPALTGRRTATRSRPGGTSSGS